MNTIETYFIFGLFSGAIAVVYGGALVISMHLYYKDYKKLNRGR